MGEASKTVEKLRKEEHKQLESASIAVTGLRSMLEGFLASCDIDKAKRMFSCNHSHAMEIIAQYNPD